MNTNALKKFAQATRRKLLTQVGSKLEQVLSTDTSELREKAEQIKKLQEEINRTGKKQLIDKVAYTWFNRLMALRFMDANDYQPIGIRVVTPKNGFTLPELLDEAKQGHIPDDLPVKKQHIYDLLDGRIPSSDPQNEAYKELLIGACNHLNKVFPFLFERIDDYTELLLPDDVTSQFSVVQDVRDGMTIDDCAEVEIIGWLYQFYISEKKDEIFASGEKVKKEDIPAATQLFTPRWIVEYMVQNTVGKLWLQNRPKSRLKDHMPYFIDSPSLRSNDYLKINSVEEITLLDQACGSGHILVYGFELIAKIYEEEGYNSNEIPQLIIEKNLYGFEIDERAAQLAGLALLMKARSYQRRLFRREITPNILCFQDLLLTKLEIKDSFNQINKTLSEELLDDLINMQQATNLGSLIIPHSSQMEMERFLELINLREKITGAFESHNLNQISTALKQLFQLGKKYCCVVDNPPYMGDYNMNKALGDFVKVNYPNSKADLMVCFMEKAYHQLLNYGHLGMINYQSWMFVSTFAPFRSHLLNHFAIDSLIHLGRGIFGSDFGTVTFCLIKQHENFAVGIYRRLFTKHSAVRSIETIRELFLDKNFGYYEAQQDGFKLVPNNNVCYWFSEKVIKNFDNTKIGEISTTKAGIVSGNDNDFLKIWSEINFKNIQFNETKFKSNSNIIWVPINKGGNIRKYYGNEEYIINLLNLWKDGRTNKSVRRGDSKYYFKEAITWTYVCGTGFSFRYSINSTFATAAPAIFMDSNENTMYTLGLLNSKVILNILPGINPTVNLGSGDISRLPFIDRNFKNTIIDITNNCVEISKNEWYSRETSWDFAHNEIIRINGHNIENCYDLYKEFWKNKFYQLHKNEEDLNRKFIDIYGLQDELTPELPLADITILKEETSIKNGELVFNSKEVFAQFVSYAVGCMFGRYSLDKEGLILANQGETLEDYFKKVTLNKNEVSFLPDDDNIIPVLDDEWFEDDITGRFYEFLKISFGKENFEKNLVFVEECLGKDIRKYFVKDFYNDHIRRYKKRPIYWMFSSPNGSFNVLIYMHRYTQNTLSEILKGYLKEYRGKLDSKVEHLNHIIETGSSTDQIKAAKDKDILRNVLQELKEYERDILYPLATERINIDLDDGVLVNYNKFGRAIKEVSGLNDKKTKDKVKKFDWINTELIR